KRDRFIELAQAALEQAIKEEDQKGVIREMVEALIARSGAPLVAEVISEQMRSQDLIEQLAERHQERRQLNDDTTPFPHTLKEPLDETLRSVNTAATYDETVEPMTLMAEYMWRFFRLLLLASIVGLIYHFL
ncbi:uncharacterized protein BYT42DRAFT_481856, partial [Radiomyces spectabilis]|uniref:uncharacterized protein n=1 Tax=Radiomyces spectabilis TaxID=64574 RepID=UPI0022208E6D